MGVLGWRKYVKINQVLHGNEIKYSLNVLTENIIKYMRYLKFLLVSNHCSVSLPTENWIEKKFSWRYNFFLTDVVSGIFRLLLTREIFPIIFTLKRPTDSNHLKKKNNNNQFNYSFRSFSAKLQFNVHNLMFTLWGMITIARSPWFAHGFEILNLHHVITAYH